MPFSTSNDHPTPALTSNNCTLALSNFLSNTSTLAVATEASSHSSGVVSLYAQPYVYSGGGLGNIKECPLQVCLAGANSRDSITFASVCIPQECTALDLAANDFVASLTRVSQAGNRDDGVMNNNNDNNSTTIESNLTNNKTTTTTTTTISDVEYHTSLKNEYVLLHTRIAQVNKFLKTGWTCGNLIIPWSIGWSSLYGLVCFMLLTFVLMGSWIVPKKTRRMAGRKRRQQLHETELAVSHAVHAHNDNDSSDTFQEEKKETSTIDDDEQSPLVNGQSSSPPTTTTPSSLFWNCWNVQTHLTTLTTQRSQTAALDGLRVFSILWIIFGHVLAIESSSGGGYSNAADFLPPHGFTTTYRGQLLFASRFAVDTFLLISGYLMVHVLVKMNTSSSNNNTTTTTMNVCRKYLTTLPALLLHRLLRILPLYCMTLGFYILVAPHMGSGPFWHQWFGLLEPCHQYGWTNLLFVNNFIPFDLPNTATCFYHSWYLALDMQLFLMSPILIFAFVKNARRGKVITILILSTSIVTSIYLGWVRKWSINTFDGAAVARYDVEAYAKPHVRAQAYLLGMLLAMKHYSLAMKQRKHARQVTVTWKHHARMMFAISLLAGVTFITASGAYARRPCRYKEWPSKDDCGSEWGPQATLWYTSLSRIVWSLAVYMICDLCLQQHGGLVGSILDLKCWTPLSHLSFAAYLVHPIIIFIWQLGNYQKETFRFLEVGMNYISVCVVSFGAAFVLALFVEFPCAALVKTYIKWRHLSRRSSGEDLNGVGEKGDASSQHLLPVASSSLNNRQHRYGALSYQQNA